MFRKPSTGKGRDPSDTLTNEKARELRAAIEERDQSIASLEQTLAEQQADIATLQEALEQEKFKTRILEQSYSTQLGEARERAAAAEQSAADRQMRIAELEASHEGLLGELAEARERRISHEPDAVSIDEMLASFAVPRERPLAYDSEAEPDAPVDPQAADEMLAPEVMFAAKRK